MSDNLYYVGNQRYNLPDEKLDAFLQTFPNAEKATRYTAGEESYTIPESKIERFIEVHPEAKTTEEEQKPGFWGELARAGKTFVKTKIPAMVGSQLERVATEGGVIATAKKVLESSNPFSFSNQLAEKMFISPEISPEDKKKFIESEPLFKIGREIRENAKARLETDPSLQLPEGYREWTFGNALAPDKIGETIGDVVPSMLLSMGTAIATTAITKNPVTGLASGGIVAYGLESGFAYDDAIEYGLTPEEATKVAHSHGAIATVLELLPVGRVIKKLGIGKQVEKQLTKKLIQKGVYKEVPKELVKQGFVESSTETLQELSSILHEAGYKDEKDLPSGIEVKRRLGQSGFGGLIAGGGTGAVVGTVQAQKKPSIEPKKAETQKEAVVTPKEGETPADAKVAPQKEDLKQPSELKTRTATYTVQDDGKIIKNVKGVESEITQEEYDEVLAQKEEAELPRTKALAHAHILEKENNISTERGKEIKKDMFGTETMAEMSTNEISEYSSFLKSGKFIEEVSVKPEELKPEKREKLIESVQKKHGQTELRIAELKKKGLTDKDIDSVVLEDGTKFSDTVKVKREKNGVLSAVITKDDIQNVKESYTKDKPVDKWVDKSKKDVPKTLKGEAKRLYELPQVIFKTSGLDRILYDPIRTEERNARDIKTKEYNEFKKAGIFKEGNFALADRFLLSKTEKENIGKYYLDRQGKRTGITFEKLSVRSKKFVETFDSITERYKDKIFEIARLNGIDLKETENYAPLMVDGELKLAEEMDLMDFITRKQPAFFSTKERIENVPIEMYEKDYAKVATVWIDKMADFITVGKTLPQIKYLTDSKEFSDIVTAWDKKYIQDWVHNIATPKSEQAWLKLARFPRKWASVAALGANIVPVVKQSLTQIPVSVIEGAPPKVRSQFAEKFKIDVKELPSIKERKGNVSIQDMQEGFARMMVGSLTQFDKYNARLSLNALLDKSYKKYKDIGIPIDGKMRDLILQEAQDKLDLWYGGMTKSQMPEAFRTEGGKLLNMFIYPLTSQLNGFYYEIAKARGMGAKSKATAEVLAVATAIAYAEIVLSKMAFDWGDEEEMAKDIFGSLMGNIPILGSIVYAFANDQAYSPSPVINSLDNIRKKSNKFKDDPDSLDELMFAAAEFFGIPKQARKLYEGFEFIGDEGFRDKKGKLLAPVLKGDRIRAVIRGKYGTLAVQEYLNNIGEKVENRKWSHPEVEFLQNGDYERKAEIYGQLDRTTRIFLYNELSKSQKDKLKKYLKGYLKRGLPN